MDVPKPKAKLSKEITNILRTTQRNNIELTHIADNKANVLLSLNGIMLTLLIPLVLANFDLIYEKFLHIPLIIFGITCFITMYISAMVLKPSRFQNFRNDKDTSARFSPFFFGNFYEMEADEFYDYIRGALSKKELVRMHLTQDLFYVGKRLGFKMTMMRRAFGIFIMGIFLTLVATVIVLGLS